MNYCIYIRCISNLREILVKKFFIFFYLGLFFYTGNKLKCIFKLRYV